MEKRYCMCGCGKEITGNLTYRKNGKIIQKRYIYGHNTPILNHTKESRQKMSINRKGKKKDKSWRKRIGIANLGKKRSKEFCKRQSKQRKGMIPWNKGIPCSEEQKKKISLTKTGDTFFTEFKTRRLQRIRKSVKYKEWRLMVFGRDNFTCQECGKKGCYLEAHHIKSFAKYPKLRFDINNGITYCKKCHIKNDKYRERFET